MSKDEIDDIWKALQAERKSSGLKLPLEAAQQRPEIKRIGLELIKLDDDVYKIKTPGGWFLWVYRPPHLKLPAEWDLFNELAAVSQLKELNTADAELTGLVFRDPDGTIHGAVYRTKARLLPDLGKDMRQEIRDEDLPF